MTEENRAKGIALYRRFCELVREAKDLGCKFDYHTIPLAFNYCNENHKTITHGNMLKGMRHLCSYLASHNYNDIATEMEIVASKFSDLLNNNSSKYEFNMDKAYDVYRQFCAIVRKRYSVNKPHNMYYVLNSYCNERHKLTRGGAGAMLRGMRSIYILYCKSGYHDEAKELIKLHDEFRNLLVVDNEWYNCYNTGM